jgi:hypothetical protein
MTISPPFGPLDLLPSVSPVAAASHQPSVCIAAAPAAVDIGLLAAPPEAPPKTLPRLVVRWPGWSLGLLQRLRCCCALVSTPPTERHSCRSGRTPHENAVSYSAWHTPIACLGVVVLYRWGGWPFPACPRTYLQANPIKARPLPSSALSCAPSQVLWTSRTPSWLRETSAIRPYTPVFARLGCQVGSLLFRTDLSQRATACDPGEVQHPFRSQNAVCCLRREISGSALPNTFRLKLVSWLQRSPVVAARWFAPL